MQLFWEDTRDVRLDDTMIFGIGYNFDGMESYREEAETPLGRFMVWPAWTGPKSDWALYGGNAGYYAQGFATADEAKAAVAALISDPD